MATMVGKSDDFGAVLKDLIELEYDAIEAYKAAIERLENSSYKGTLGEFLSDHNRHIQDLINLARTCGIDAPNGPDAKQILTKGKVVMAELFGDKTILAAMKTNEDDTVTAYERVSKHKDLPAGASAIMERGLADELRHRAWMIEASSSKSKAA